MTTPHQLRVTEGPDHKLDEDEITDWRYEVVCTSPTTCNGVDECGEEHVVDGHDASMGPHHGEAEGRPWADEDEFTFHGVVHTWHYGYGWTVPHEGCVVASSVADDPDSAQEIANRHGAGLHDVDVEWDEGAWLEYAGDVTE